MPTDSCHFPCASYTLARPHWQCSHARKALSTTRGVRKGGVRHSPGCQPTLSEPRPFLSSSRGAPFFILGGVPGCRITCPFPSTQWNTEKICKRNDLSSDMSSTLSFLSLFFFLNSLFFPCEGFLVFCAFSPSFPGILGVRQA